MTGIIDIILEAWTQAWIMLTTVGDIVDDTRFSFRGIASSFPDKGLNSASKSLSGIVGGLSRGPHFGVTSAT